MALVCIFVLYYVPLKKRPHLSTKMKILSVSTPTSLKVVLLYWNNIFAFHLYAARHTKPRMNLTPSDKRWKNILYDKLNCSNFIGFSFSSELKIFQVYLIEMVAIIVSSVIKDNFLSFTLLAVEPFAFRHKVLTRGYWSDRLD